MPLRRAACVLAALALACGGDEPRRPTGYNVVLISLDSARRDFFGAYGHRPRQASGLSTSPRIDRLAAEGVLMEDAYATTSWTLASHASIFTGQPEVVHGVDLDFHRIPADRPVLAEILKQAGYATAGFYSGPYLDPAFGFGRGFERYEACYGKDLSAAMERQHRASEELARAEAARDASAVERLTAESRAIALEVEDLSHEDVSSQAVTDAALGALDAAARGGRPFFLFAHYFDPHYDYMPPAPYATRFDPDYAGSLDARGFFTSEAIGKLDPAQPGKRVRTISERDLDHVRALYEGELAWTDDQIGRILDRLGELGLAERTLVVVTADHGDEFFEHGSIGHRSSLFEELVQAPLVLRLPGVLPSGRRVKGLVSTIDIVPTVLEVLGLEEPAGLVSRSLLPRIRGAEAGEPERGVMGRLVTVLPIAFDVPSGDGVEKLPGTLVTILETYREGAIKVSRRREWTRFDGQHSPEVDAAMAKQTREMRAEESLVWVDLARSPLEPPEAHVTSFSDARAMTVLRAFHDRYAEWLERKTRAEVGGGAPELGGALRGLGYTGDERTIEAIAHEDFALPPPGAKIPR